MNIGPVTVGPGAPAQPVAPPPTPRATATSGPAATNFANQPPAKVAANLRDALVSYVKSKGQRQADQLTVLLSRLVRTSLTGTGSTAGASGSLAFLRDPRLSVEEKLARLMISLSDKYEKQLEEKLKQFGDLEAGRRTGGTARRSGGSSPLGALGAGIASLVGKTGFGGALLGGPLLSKLVGQLSGPVLAGAATALGMPMLAPALLKAGPLLGSLATGAAASLAGAGGAGSATGTASGASSAPSEKQLMTEIQILQEKQKEMFSLVSNILRSLHDTKMAVIGNIR